VLGIETSCDETAAAVVAEGRRTLSNVVASQIAVHSPYGGVVPELASREHLRNIVPVVRAALAGAGCSYADLDGIAVTAGPGLAGALLVGITYAKALAFATVRPLVAVNHLEGHIHAVLLEQAAAVPGGEVPVLALVVSGGHTHLYLARRGEAGWRYRNLGRTLDDAAGEAFDKVAKLLGLGYPGGPWIDELAAHGDPGAVPFAFSQIKPKAHLRGRSPRTRNPGGRGEAEPQFLFSFSGIKTAVLRHVETQGLRAGAEARAAALGATPAARPADALALCDRATLDLSASFQHAVIGDLLRKSVAAAEAVGARTLLVSGGVAANRELCRRFWRKPHAAGSRFSFPRWRFRPITRP
jgi:N6-L-threonylcarbamoyladenine synthase